MKGVFLGFADPGSWEDRSPGALTVLLDIVLPSDSGESGKPCKKEYYEHRRAGLERLRKRDHRIRTILRYHVTIAAGLDVEIVCLIWLNHSVYLHSRNED